jgi:hypothetical protein
MALPATYTAFGVSESHNAVSVIGHPDKLARRDPYAIWRLYDLDDGKWYQFKPLAGIRPTSIWYGEKGEGAHVVAERGEVWAVLRDQVTKQPLPDSGSKGRKLGSPNFIRKIGERLYVCGYAGQIYTLAGKQWLHMDDGVVEKKPPTAKSLDLTGIDGSARDDLYVCGSGGFLAHWDGKAWTRIPIVTNLYLSAIRCPRKDWIIAVGDRGIVVESDGKSWQVSTIPGADELTLAAVEVYRERVFVAAEGVLFVKKGKTWEKVQHGLDAKTTFIDLRAGLGRLWTLGYQRLSSFDGKKWRAHIDPNNG